MNFESAKQLQGNLKKKGSAALSGWQKRFFFIVQTDAGFSLLYKDSQNDDKPKGEIQLQGIERIEAINERQFTLFHPNREYQLETKTKEDTQRWVSGLTLLLNQSRNTVGAHHSRSRSVATAPLQFLGNNSSTTANKGLNKQVQESTLQLLKAPRECQTVIYDSHEEEALADDALTFDMLTSKRGTRTLSASYNKTREVTVDEWKRDTATTAAPDSEIITQQLQSKQKGEINSASILHLRQGKSQSQDKPTILFNAAAIPQKREVPGEKIKPTNLPEYAQQNELLINEVQMLEQHVRQLEKRLREGENVKEKLLQLELSAEKQTLALEKEKRELSQQLIEAKERCEQLQEKQQKLVAELKDLKSQNFNWERLVSVKEKAITTKEGEVEELTKQLNLLRENGDEQTKSVHAHLQSLQLKNKNLQEQLSQKESALIAKERVITEKDVELESLREELEIFQTQKISGYQSQISELQQNCFVKDSDVRRLENTVKDLKKQMQFLSAKPSSQVDINSPILTLPSSKQTSKQNDKSNSPGVNVDEMLDELQQRQIEIQERSVKIENLSKENTALKKRVAELEQTKTSTLQDQLQSKIVRLSQDREILERDLKYANEEAVKAKLQVAQVAWERDQAQQKCLRLERENSILIQQSTISKVEKKVVQW